MRVNNYYYITVLTMFIIMFYVVDWTSLCSVSLQILLNKINQNIKKSKKIEKVFKSPEVPEAPSSSIVSLAINVWENE